VSETGVHAEVISFRGFKENGPVSAAKSNEDFKENCSVGVAISKCDPV
jgi:hypothetical protein